MEKRFGPVSLAEVGLLPAGKQFVPAFSLRVGAVLDLQPALPVIFWACPQAGAALGGYAAA